MTSQWDDNDAMWDFVAETRRGGKSYAEIHVSLAVDEKERFGLLNVPSEAVIRYNLIKRRLLGKNQSDLPKDELEEHHKGLVFIGGVFRYQIDAPPDLVRLKNSRTEFLGFGNDPIFRPTAKTEIEEEIQEEWDESESSTHKPEIFSRYVYFRQHMDCTLIGRKVNHALDAVKRTATEYNSERLKLLAHIEIVINAATDGVNDPDVHAMSLLRLVEPMNNPSSKLRSTRQRAKSPKGDGLSTSTKIYKELESTKANSELVKKLRKLTTAQNNLKSALTPVELIRKMVRDSECDLCSSKSLERAE